MLTTRVIMKNNELNPVGIPVERFDGDIIREGISGVLGDNHHCHIRGSVNYRIIGRNQ